MRSHEQNQGPELASRRAFLGSAARSLFGLSTLPLFARASGAVPLAFAEDGVKLRPASARHVIYLYLSGGLSHLDSFDPKPGHENQGPVEAIDTKVAGIRVSQHFPLLAQQMEKVALIRSMSSTQGAHTQGRYFLHTGYELRGTIRHPSLGAWLSQMAGPIHPNLPAHVSVGGDAFTAQSGFLESIHAPLPIGDPLAGLQHGKPAKGVTESRFDERLARLAKMNQEFEQGFDQKPVRAYGDMYEQAVRLMRSKDLAAFDITQEPEWVREAYGDQRFGQGCLLARRLVEHGVRFVEIVSDGWDTHIDNFDRLEDQCPAIDRGLAALLADLDARGLLSETLVVLATEFGRTPQIVSGRNGRNHHPKAFSALLAGGGIRGGQVWGATDAEGEEVIADKVSIPDFNATLAHALGLPLDHITTSASGRPFTVADKGQPVLGLFA
ncbi:MAG: DUF1501 domain-containing protein [Planctomycetes bacterium]|nr:DUF1501 domain-containing protein [Planctomycetota bacterium]